MPRRLLYGIAFSAFLIVSATAQNEAPKVDLEDLQGGHHTLEEYKGKVVLLNFWATWCVPCAAEMPLLNEMQRRYKDRIVILAASIDDPSDRDKLVPFLHKHKADDLTLMVGPTLDTLELFGMSSALPDTLFYDAGGKLAGKSVGALKRADLERRLARMTGTPEAKATSGVSHKGKGRNTGEK